MNLTHQRLWACTCLAFSPACLPQRQTDKAQASVGSRRCFSVWALCRKARATYLGYGGICQHWGWYSPWGMIDLPINNPKMNKKEINKRGSVAEETQDQRISWFFFRDVVWGQHTQAWGHNWNSVLWYCSLGVIDAALEHCCPHGYQGFTWGSNRDGRGCLGDSSGFGWKLAPSIKHQI